MLILFLCSIAITVFGLLILNIFTMRNFFLESAGVTFILVGMLGFGVLGINGFNYKAAEHQTRLINQEFDTNYTVEEVFYAESVIAEILHLKRDAAKIKPIKGEK